MNRTAWSGRPRNSSPGALAALLRLCWLPRPAKVPAAEIEFPWDVTMPAAPPLNEISFPLPLDDALDICWTAPRLNMVANIDSPPIFRLLVRNHSGVERTLPRLTAGVDPARRSDGAVTIDTGLCWMHPLAYWANADHHGPWTPLPLPESKRPTFSQPQRPLAPGEVFEVLRWDLKEQFGPLRPGWYGFRMKIGPHATQSVEYPDVFFVLIGGQTRP